MELNVVMKPHAAPGIPSQRKNEVDKILRDLQRKNAKVTVDAAKPLSEDVPPAMLALVDADVLPKLLVLRITCRGKELDQSKSAAELGLDGKTHLEFEVLVK